MQTDPREPLRLAYSIREAARVSTIGRSTLYRHISAGRLKITKVGGRTLIPADALRRLVTGEG